MISIIPQPVSIQPQPGSFALSPHMLERWQSDGIEAIATLHMVHDTELGAEGYELVVSPEAVHIHAPTPAGHFYAEQTLRQLVNEESHIPCLTIRDYPRFSWRGMHLDVSRHFFPVEFIKRYLDILALHKLNTFHWHLTDDQGWRIEIKRYPRLTGIGAWRVNREDMPWNERPPQDPNEIADYGGFYTQEQIADIVTYAADRSITVVPEIEMPAHALAALAAYSEFSCTGGPFTVASGQYWPDTDLFCAGNDETFVFLENILTEVAALFPGEFIHIGGDEADKREWEKCPKCRQRMREQGIESLAGLQSYFITRVGRILQKLNKRLIGWDEILEGGLPASAAVMSWRGTEGGIAAARQGHDVVMCPASHLYFDHYQADPATQPKAFGGFSPLSKVYAFEPIPAELSASEAQHILGAQANLWTEYVPTTAHGQYMVLPRIAALAEVVWSPQVQRNWDGFAKRLPLRLAHYSRLGLQYCQNWE
ncbi:MAG TPA: beta-N-acetylhexosaminidase [bacterium]|jgi:hexosaminidase